MRWARGISGERGSTTVEYTTLVLWVAAVAAALTALAGPVRTAIVDAIRCAVDGDACTTRAAAEPVTAPDPAEPKVTCTKSTEERTSSITTDSLFTREYEGSRYHVSERTDGALEILDTESKGTGKSVFLGGGVKLGKEKVGLSADASRVRVEETGDVYVLETPEDRAMYDELRRQEAVQAYVHGGANPDPDFEHAKQMARLMLRDRSYTRLSDETSLSISGGARYVRGGVSVEGETGSIVEEDDKTGDTTITFDVKTKATGDVGVIVLGGVSLSGDGTVSTSVTLDDKGVPKKLSIVGETAAGGGSDLGINAGDAVDLPSFVSAAAGIRTEDEKAGVARVTTELELKDEESRAAALAFVDDPRPATARPLADLFRRSGTALVEILERDASSTKHGLSVSLLGSLGFEGEDSVSTTALKDAWSWRPRTGARHETECTK